MRAIIIYIIIMIIFWYIAYNIANSLKNEIEKIQIDQQKQIDLLTK